MAVLNQASHQLFWPDHIQAWQHSGLSQSAYCREHDLCPQKLSYWKRKLLFSPVLAPAANVGFARIQVDTQSASDVGFELSLQFPDGTRLLGIPADNLTLIKSLVDVLR